MPLSDAKYQRLVTSIKQSYSQMGDWRSRVVEFVREYAGELLTGGRGAEMQKQTPVNLIEQAVNIYMRNLSARNPKVRNRVRSNSELVKFSGEMLELALNQWLFDNDFDDSVRGWVKNALFGVGMVKVGMERGGRVGIDGKFFDVGKPFVEVVDIDDIILDMSAKRTSHCYYIGHRYRMLLDDFKQDESFAENVRNHVSAAQSIKRNPDGSESTSEIYKSDTTELMPDDYVTLVEVYIPSKKVIVTYAEDYDTLPLRIEDFQGPDEGPFHLLYFDEVPGNVLPLSIVSLLYDLHTLSNTLYSKLGQQAKRQKTVTGFRAGAENDADRVAKAGDGDIIKMDQEPGQVAEFRYGGADANTFQFAQHTRELFSYMGGNLDALGGLSSMANTLGQEQILTGNASMRIVDLQSKVKKAVDKVIRSIAWYLWYDPFIKLPMYKRSGVDDSEMMVVYTDEMKTGEFLDNNISIVAYSMQDMTPAMEFQAVQGLMNTLVGPLMPLLQQQGKTIDASKLISESLHMLNLDHLSDMFCTNAAPQYNMENSNNMLMSMQQPLSGAAKSAGVPAIPPRKMGGAQ